MIALYMSELSRTLNFILIFFFLPVHFLWVLASFPLNRACSLAVSMPSDLCHMEGDFKKKKIVIDASCVAKCNFWTHTTILNSYTHLASVFWISVSHKKEAFFVCLENVLFASSQRTLLQLLTAMVIEGITFCPVHPSFPCQQDITWGSNEWMIQIFPEDGSG